MKLLVDGRISAVASPIMLAHSLKFQISSLVKLNLQILQVPELIFNSYP